MAEVKHVGRLKHLGERRDSRDLQSRTSQGDVPAPEQSAEVPSPIRYHMSGDLGWLIQMMSEMQRDFGGLKQQVSSLDRSIQSHTASVESLLKWSYHIRGGAVVLLVVLSFSAWLFSERLEDLRRAIVAIPAQQSQPAPPAKE
jgi:hypothetical protein